MTKLSDSDDSDSHYLRSIFHPGPLLKGVSLRGLVCGSAVLGGICIASLGWAADPSPASPHGPGPVLPWVSLILLLFSGIVSGTETAIFSLDRLEILRAKGEKSPSARALSRLLENPNDALTTLLILNNSVNVGLSLAAGAMAESYFRASGVAALGAAGIAVTASIVTFGEVLPKCVSQVHARRWALAMAWPIAGCATLLTPFRAVMNAFISYVFERLDVPEATEDEIVSEEELKAMMGVGQASTLLEEDERDMILSVFELDNTFAEEIMIPRSEVEAVELSLGQDELLTHLRATHHSRILAYEDDLDNLLGFVLAKEVLLQPDRAWRERVRDIICIPGRMRLDELLTQFRRQSAKIAAVVDEYGQVSGIVTLHDLLEEIVGEITERHEKADPEIRSLDENSFAVLGRAKLSDLSRELGIDFPTDMGSTAGGFIMNTLGKVPNVGAQLAHGGYDFKVKRMMGRRIIELAASPSTAPTPSEPVESRGEAGS